MLSLIVNPSSGGGRSARALPAVRAALGRYGLEHHVELTLDLDHARSLARGAVAAGEMPVAYGGDGLVAAVADAVRETGGVLGVLPGGRGNDFARCLGLPVDPVDAVAVLADGRPRAIDMGAAGDHSFLGIATCGFDSEANRIANSARLIRGRFVYTYGGLRALATWRPASFTLRVDGVEHALYGYTVSVANAPMHGGGMLIAPEASLDDGQFDVVMIADLSKRRFLRLLPTVFRGEHVRQDEVRILRGSTVELSADRPFTVYADGDPLAVLPATLRVLPAAVRVMAPSAVSVAARCGRSGVRAMTALGTKIRIARSVGEVVRASGRGGGTSLPGKVLLRLEPDAIAELAARLPNGSAVISATNGKTTTATIAATILERAGRTLVHNRAGANMAGGIASTLLAAARPRGGIAGDSGLFEVDEFWLDSVTQQLKPRVLLLSQPVP